jgi:hypothetical protein
MAAELTKIKVDGKEINLSEMPKHCFLIQGEWYTEKGLPSHLSSYKFLWDKPAPVEEPKKKSKPQATQTLSLPDQDVPTAK